MTGNRLAGFIATLCLAGSSSAAPITWEFEGTVRYADLGDATALAGSLGVSVGASAFGRVVYESTTPDTLPGSGTYADALIAFEVTIGSYSPTGLGLGAFFDFFVRPVAQPLALYGHELALASGAADALFPWGPIVTLDLIANAPGVIPDSSLPFAPPPLSALRPFSLADWLGLDFGTGLQLYGSGMEQVLVELTRLEAVPEPSILAVVAPFVLALVALRRR